MESSQYQPYADRVFVRPEPITKVGSIHVPQFGASGDPARAQTACLGTVVSVGRGAYTKKLVFVTPDLQAGDRVLFSRFSGVEVEVNGEKLKALFESDIQAVIEPDAKVEVFQEL